MEKTGFIQFISLQDVKAVVIAGVIAETIFELYAWLVSSILFDQVLQPSNLVIAIARITLGIELPHGAAFAVQAFIGSIGFASCMYLIKKVSKLTYRVASIVTGILLWFVAQGILAPFIGRHFMMVFGPCTQTSFIGHTGKTVIIAWILRQQSENR